TYANNAIVGTATASYTSAGDDNHTGSDGSKTFAVAKASTTTVVSCSVSEIYTGSPLTPCTVAVTGANLNSTPAPTYANNVTVGTATASYTYGGDDNHTGSADSKTFAIAKASTTTVVTCTASEIYTGSAITPCCVAVTGAHLYMTPAPTYANNVIGGTASASYTYGGDDNHTGSADSKTFAIAKASTTTVVTCTASEIYTGSPLTPCSVAVTGANLSMTPAPTYANNVIVG